MKKQLSLLFTMLFAMTGITQPLVYINFVSHNEPGDNLQTVLNYNKAKSRVLQLASIIDSKGAAWNLQTCDGFVKGAIDHEGASSNLFRTLKQNPYADNMEFDPRSKQSFYPTIADLYHILDSLGAQPTNTLGGFVFATSNQGVQPIDWFTYQDTIYSQSLSYPTVKWKCNIMWGAGSYPPHANDLNDYGIWKPDTVNVSNPEPDFRVHNPARSVWYIGNGCPPANTQHPVNPGSFDSTDSPQDVIAPLHDFIDSIQALILPQQLFYNVSITINQSEFGPMLFSKIGAICDSVNSWGTSKIVWANLSEKLTAFQSWQTTAGVDSSQWSCGQLPANITEQHDSFSSWKAYPNPAGEELIIETIEKSPAHEIYVFSGQGQLLIQSRFSGSRLVLNTSNWKPGVYFLRLNGESGRSIIVY